MAENGLFDDIRRGRGCGYGHENRIMAEMIDKRFDEFKDYFEAQRKELMWIKVLIGASIIGLGGSELFRIVSVVLK